jgi:anti-sigma regulatory factor (Ser/Thr protein kinase)
MPAQPATPPFRARLPATAPSVAILRTRLRAWLEARNVHPGEIFDIVLACSECMTLVLEQRRRVALVVDVEGTIEEGELTVTTRDYGLWQRSRAQTTEEPLSLSLMRAFMDSVELRRHYDGHTIRLRRRLGPTTRERHAVRI